MDAAPFLAEVGALLGRLRLDAVLIGNAAAALQGAPVTTVDLDFFFRKTAGNLRKVDSAGHGVGRNRLASLLSGVRTLPRRS